MVALMEIEWVGQWGNSMYVLKAAETADLTVVELVALMAVGKVVSMANLTTAVLSGDGWIDDSAGYSIHLKVGLTVS